MLITEWLDGTRPVPVFQASGDRELAARFGRTEKAFEYRMQNISALLFETRARVP